MFYAYKGTRLSATKATLAVQTRSGVSQQASWRRQHREPLWPWPQRPRGGLRVDCPASGPGRSVYFQSPHGPEDKGGRGGINDDDDDDDDDGLDEKAREGHCQEEEIPELELDVDELLDMKSGDTQAARVKELLVDCYKPTEAFISGLLDKIRGMQKLSMSTSEKKSSTPCSSLQRAVLPEIPVFRIEALGYNLLHTHPHPLLPKLQTSREGYCWQASPSSPPIGPCNL
ncbi:phosphatase 1 regulatory subunit 14B [Sigmodon hispidus]